MRIDANQLRAARGQAGYTQADLASDAKITQQYVSWMETGRGQDCSDIVARRVAEVLGVALDALTAPPETTSTRGSSEAA